LWFHSCIGISKEKKTYLGHVNANDGTGAICIPFVFCWLQTTALCQQDVKSTAARSSRVLLAAKNLLVPRNWWH